MKFAFFLASALAFFSTLALALTVKPKIITKENYVVQEIPILRQDSLVPLFSAQGVMVKDLSSGVTLYEKNPDLALLPASTTKVMTALVALEEYNLEDVVKVSVSGVEGQKMRLVLGEEILVKDLLYGALVFSANDAAEALAAFHPGGREEFLRLMNTKASELNLANTHFENPTGLDGVTQVSSARDMVRLSEAAMEDQQFADFVATKEITVRSTDDRFVHKLTNINILLEEVDGVLGVKTGWTENARENLVTYIDRNNRPLIIAVLGSQDRFGETTKLIDWIFSNYSWEEFTLPDSDAAEVSDASEAGTL